LSVTASHCIEFPWRILHGTAFSRKFLGKELRDHWDVRINLDVDFSVVEGWASLRDAENFGSAEKAREATKVRYHGAQKIHIQEARPADSAHFVVQNSEPQQARITARRLL
jgi:uridine kinase